MFAYSDSLQGGVTKGLETRLQDTGYCPGVTIGTSALVMVSPNKYY